MQQVLVIHKTSTSNLFGNQNVSIFSFHTDDQLICVYFLLLEIIHLVNINILVYCKSYYLNQCVKSTSCIKCLIVHFQLPLTEKI